MPASKLKPTVVFVGGVFHVPAHFEEGIDALAKLEYPALAVQPPEVEEAGSVIEPYGNVEAIRSVLHELIVNNGKEVILVCHSAGGSSGCQTVKGLERSLREKNNEPGGVVYAVFLSAFCIPEGGSIIEVLGGSLPTWADVEPERGIIRPSAACAPIFFSGLDEAGQKKYGDLLAPERLAGSDEPVVNTPWDVDVRKAYIFTTEDAVADNDQFASMLNQVKAGHKDQWTVLEIASDHAPFLSKPDEFARLIATLA
ncbi:MAG: hypothetical protein M1828_002150 [Chrysothrix sp. TS-e1954]|nr:MAG: hypothetical protein M1828_002150 [Chrysothrix sp. TS-e1954]